MEWSEALDIVSIIMVGGDVEVVLVSIALVVDVYETNALGTY